MVVMTVGNDEDKERMVHKIDMKDSITYTIPFVVGLDNVSKDYESEANTRVSDKVLEFIKHLQPLSR